MLPKFESLHGIVGFLRHPPRLTPIAFALLLTACLAFVVGVRLNQVRQWHVQRETSFAGDVPMMTTVDAYFWLRWAREYSEGRLDDSGNDALRNYPDGKLRGNPVKPHKPLLSLMLAAFSRLFGTSVYLAGLYLVPFLSGLFALPLALYMRRIGFPLAGLIGSALAAVSYEYYIRTSVGRVDTDCLNLFFMTATPYFILMTETRGDFGAIAFSSLAGLVSYFFNWWYDLSSLMGIFFVLLLVKFALNRTPLRTALVAAFFFIVFCDPGYFFGTVHNLLERLNRLFPSATPAQTSAPQASTAPDAMQTITELETFGFKKTLGLMFGGNHFVEAGLVLFGVMLLANPDRLLPLLPLLGVGLLAFGKGRRFTMYLAPFVGIGWGYGISLASALFLKAFEKRPSLEKRKKKKPAAPPQKPRTLLTDAVITISGLVFFWFALPETAVSYLPTTKIDAGTYANLVKLKPLLPPEARVWNYWNYGYLITDTVGRPTYSDGGMPGSVKTYFVSRGYSASSPRELYDIVSFIDRKGEQGIYELMEKQPDFSVLANAVARDTTPPPDENIYIAFTGNMIDQFPSINFIGAWNFEKNAGDRKGYNQLSCHSANQGILACDEGTIDMNKGTINGQPLIARTIAVETGREKQRIDVREEGYVLEIILDQGKIRTVILLTEPGFESNFNQMFILGRYAPDLFQPVYDAFPALRVYRMKRTAALP